MNDNTAKQTQFPEVVAAIEALKNTAELIPTVALAKGRDAGHTHS